MKKLYKKYASSEYLRNVLTLSSGTTVAQLVSLGTAPILYRIYSKEDYGTLGLYMAIVGVIGVFSTMQYTEAILLEKADEGAKEILWLNRIINIGFTLISVLLIIVLSPFVGKWFNNEGITNWLFLIPISIFFTGQNAILRVWANRKKMYKILALNSILISLLVPLVSITTGYLIAGPLGLFLGLLTSQVVPALVLLYSLSSRFELNKRSVMFNSRLVFFAKKYIDFPRFNLFSEFVSRFSNQLPVFMLSSYLGPGVVGLYNLSVRMLSLPVQIIGNSISEVFKQRAAEDYSSKRNCKKVFIKTLKSLSVISIVPFIVLLLFGPSVFSFVFGEEWRQSGVIAQLLSVMYVLKFIASPLSYVYIIVQKLKEDLFWHIWILFSTAIIFYMGINYKADYQAILMIFSINYGLVYLIYILRSYSFSISNADKSIIKNSI